MWSLSRWRDPKWTSGSGNSYTWKNCLHEPSCKALSSLLWPLLIFSLSPLGSVRLIYIGCKKFQRLGNGHDSLPSLSFQITHGNPYKPWFTLKYDYIIGLRWVKCNPQSFLLCWKGRFHPPAWREAFDDLSTLNENLGSEVFWLKDTDTSFHSVFPGPSLTGPDPAFTHKHFQELMAFISWNYIMELTLIPDTDVGAVLLFWWRDRARVVLWKFGWTWDVFDLVWRAGKSARQTCCSSFKSGVSLWLDIMFMTSDGAQHVVQWISQDTYQGDIGDWGNLAIRHKHVVHTHGSD